ncbi:hypothetical protein [Shimia sp. MMG029]|uniref:hypothetical protein n=1 Tax=Shimia sp. MMG029 TaxID=3021978 RepID=UPI0022FF30B2|nr:hypothetical protein [Shimia sp. MMG029]MDA5559066.1 hypothetical protein [Shimia sp. MMG029]
MSDKEDIEEEGLPEPGQTAEPSDASDTGYEELLAKMRGLQEKVQLMGPIDAGFDMKRFSDELSDEVEK